MPMVDGKSYSYDRKGIAAAKRAAIKKAADRGPISKAMSSKPYPMQMNEKK